MSPKHPVTAECGKRPRGPPWILVRYIGQTPNPKGEPGHPAIPSQVSAPCAQGIEMA